MNVPTQVMFSTLPGAGVFTTNLTSWWMKLSPTSAVDLHDATINSSYTGTEPVFYFPGATLVIA